MFQVRAVFSFFFFCLILAQHAGLLSQNSPGRAVDRHAGTQGLFFGSEMSNQNYSWDSESIFKSCTQS